MKAVRRKIEIIMARKGMQGKDIKIPKSTMQNIPGRIILVNQKKRLLNRNVRRSLTRRKV